MAVFTAILIGAGCTEDDAMTTTNIRTIDELSVDIDSWVATKQVADAFPVGSDASDILRAHRDTQTICVERNNQIACRGPATLHGLLSLRWMVTFDIDDDGKVTAHDLRMGRTGP